MNSYMEQILNIIWYDNSPLGQLIIAVIGGLLFLSFSSALVHICRYRFLETHRLNRVKGRVRRRKGEQHTIQGTEANQGTETEEEESDAEEKNEDSEEVEQEEEEEETTPQILIDVKELRRGISSRSIIGKRLEAIAKMREAQVKVNVNSLQQMSLTKESSSFFLGIPGFVVGIAMMLGMLGTFIGLIVMVREIDLALPTGLQPEDALELWTRSIENIRKILDGMKIAFSTTIVGLICAICSSGLNFPLRRAQAAFFEKLERFTTEELLPATVPAVEDETLLEKVSLQLETSFNRLNEISEQNQQTLQDLDGIETAFMDIVGQVQKVAESGASRDIEGVIGELTRVNNSITDITEVLPETLRRIQNDNQNVMNQLASLMEKNMEKNQEQISRLMAKGTRPAPSLTITQLVLIIVLIFFLIIGGYTLWPHISKAILG